MSKIVYRYNDNYELKFGGDDFPSILKWVKMLPHATYNPTSKRWIVPVSEESTRALTGARWNFIGEASPNKIDVTKAKTFPPLQPFHKEGLWPFQNEAVAFGISRNDNWLLTLPMGSGKGTLTSVWLGERGRKALIICPASMKVQWQRELKKWAGFDSAILNGIYPYDDIDFSDVDAYIINYEILSYWFNKLRRKIEYVVVDECQKIANPEAKQTKAVIALCREAKAKVFVSGTPARNRPRELFTVLNLIDPALFNKRYAFYNRYCDPKPGYRGVLTYDGATNVMELHGLLKNYMYRKTKEEILPDLPQKNKIIYLVSADKTKSYEKAEKKLLDSIESGTKKEQKEAIASVCLEAYYMKKDILFEKIDEWLEENPDEKLVIFAYHTVPVNELYERYKKIAVCISGATPAGKRQEYVDEFQTGKARVFVGQMQAAGVGLTLTAARTTVFAELWYVPADMAQAEDRTHRFTSTGDFVQYFYYVAAGTVEEKMMKMVDKKSGWMGSIMDGKEGSYFDENEIFDMIAEDK